MISFKIPKAMNPEKFEILDYIVDEDEYMRERGESLEEAHRDNKKLNEDKLK